MPNVKGANPYKVANCLIQMSIKKNTFLRNNSEEQISKGPVGEVLENDVFNLSFRGKLLLLVVGSLIGISLGCLVGFLGKKYLSVKAPAGSEFATVDEFRRTMMERDSRDIQADGSVSLRSIIEPHQSDDIIYTLRPGLDLKFQGVQVTTNSLGMRGPERVIEKPPGTLRVALLGDSFAFGWGVEQKEGFAQIIEDRMNSTLRSLNSSGEKVKKIGLPQRVEVLNFGVPGYSTFQETALFKERAMPFSPDAVLIYFVENDFGLPFFIKSFHDGAGMVDSTAALKDRKDLSQEAKARKKKIIDQVNPNRTLKTFAEFCHERGIKVFLVINPGPKEAASRKKLWLLKGTRRGSDSNDNAGANFNVEVVNPAIGENISDIPVGKAYITLLNLRPRILARIERENIPTTALSLPTDPHPSALKHTILGELMAEDLSAYLGFTSSELPLSKQQGNSK